MKSLFIRDADNQTYNDGYNGQTFDYGQQQNQNQTYNAYNQDYSQMGYDQQKYETNLIYYYSFMGTGFNQQQVVGAG